MMRLWRTQWTFIGSFPSFTWPGTKTTRDGELAVAHFRTPAVLTECQSFSATPCRKAEDLLRMHADPNRSGTWWPSKRVTTAPKNRAWNEIRNPTKRPMGTRWARRRRGAVDALQSLRDGSWR